MRQYIRAHSGTSPAPPSKSRSLTSLVATPPAGEAGQHQTRPRTAEAAPGRHTDHAPAPAPDISYHAPQQTAEYLAPPRLSRSLSKSCSWLRPGSGAGRGLDRTSRSEGRLDQVESDSEEGSAMLGHSREQLVERVVRYSVYSVMQQGIT